MLDALSSAWQTAFATFAVWRGPRCSNDAAARDFDYSIALVDDFLLWVLLGDLELSSFPQGNFQKGPIGGTNSQSKQRKFFLIV